MRADSGNSSKTDNNDNDIGMIHALTNDHKPVRTGEGSQIVRSEQGSIKAHGTVCGAPMSSMFMAPVPTQAPPIILLPTVQLGHARPSLVISLKPVGLPEQGNSASTGDLDSQNQHTAPPSSSSPSFLFPCCVATRSRQLLTHSRSLHPPRC